MLLSKAPLDQNRPSDFLGSTSEKWKPEIHSEKLEPVSIVFTNRFPFEVCYFQVDFIVLLANLSKHRL